MVYITSRRYTNRTNPLTDIKVYSNLKEVTLYVNGKRTGSLKPDEMRRLVWKDIRLEEGQNDIRVEGKDGKTIMTLLKQIRNMEQVRFRFLRDLRQ